MYNRLIGPFLTIIKFDVNAKQSKYTFSPLRSSSTTKY